MQWYLWVLIAIAVIGLGFIKLYLFAKLKNRKKGNQTKTDKDED